MTQGELDAGGRGVIDAATAAGYGAFINLDQARGIAAVVIRKVDAHRAAHAAATEPSNPIDVAAAAAHHAVGFFSDVLGRINGDKK